MAASSRVRDAPAPPAAAAEELPDAELLARIAEGRGDAFDELYRRYAHELYDFAARITHDRAAAADVVQTVFTTVWEHARRGEQVRSPRAWLYRVTHNAAIDDLRRRRWTAPAEDEQSFDFAALEATPAHDPAHVLVDKELAELVWSTAATLKPDDYALLDLHVRRELSADELAAELGISTGAVHTRLSRLRRSFEEALTVELLMRRGREDCDELAYLVERLGERAETDEGRRLLRAHIRDCTACQESRRRYVTAVEVLGALAPVPLLPGVQAAIWAALAGLHGGAAAAHAGGAGAAHAQGHGSLTASAGAHPVAAVAAVVAALAVVGLGVWAGARALAPGGTAAVRDPTGFRSPNHPAGTPSSVNRITVAWSREPSAVAYSVLWDHAPRTEPDTVPDLPGRATQTTSPPLAAGRWYFHLRTEGADRGWTDTVHLGPFVVTAPPSGVPGPAQPETATGTAQGGAPAGATGSGGGAAAPAAPAGTGGAGTTAPAATPDTTPPSGQAVELAGGRYYRTLAVPLVLKPGTDAQSGVDSGSGVVERRAGALADGTCGGWSGWQRIALAASTDTAVADGRCYQYRYRVSDRAGNASAFSAPSGAAAVDTTPPATPTLSLAEDGPDTIVAGTTLIYRPGGAGGSFVAAAGSSDAGSGLAAITFPALGGGMSPGSPTRRPAPPYSVTYTWATGAAESGTKLVVATDRAGNTSRTAFAIVADADGPEGAAVAVTGGPWFTAPSVPLVVTTGSDGVSGVDASSPQLERDVAPLANGDCGEFAGTWKAVELQAGADPSVEGGRCYRYRVSVADKVGNRSTSPPSAEARVDTTPPSRPVLTLHEASATVHVSGTTLFYRAGATGAFSLEAVAEDPEGGIALVTFPALAGASGGGADDRAPFTSSYAWGAGFAASGGRSVVVENAAGASAQSYFTLVPDGSPPADPRVRLDGGPWFSLASVPLVVTPGADDGSGIDPASLRLERDSAPLADGDCGPFSGTWTTVSLERGADTSVEGGRCYRYRVSVADEVGNRSTSPPSAEARVDTTPPLPPVLTLRDGSGVILSRTAVVYDGAGSFTIAAAAEDPESGIAVLSFPVLAGAQGGGADDDAPYETRYSWGDGFAATGVQLVTASNRAGLSADAAFTLSRDVDPPTGMAIILLAGPVYTGGAVPFRIVEGTDAGSGIKPGSAVVERDSATLDAAGVCGPYSGTWTTLDVPGGGGADTTVESGHCYRYRVTVSDNAGNRGTSEPTGDAIVP